MCGLSFCQVWQKQYQNTETKFCPMLIFFISVCGINFCQSSPIVLKEGGRGAENKMILAGRIKIVLLSF